MTELDLVQHARAWLKAGVRLANYDSEPIRMLCYAMATAYEDLASEEAARGRNQNAKSG